MNSLLIKDYYGRLFQPAAQIAGDGWRRWQPEPGGDVTAWPWKGSVVYDAATGIITLQAPACKRMHRAGLTECAVQDRPSVMLYIDSFNISKAAGTLPEIDTNGKVLWQYGDFHGGALFAIVENATYVRRAQVSPARIV